MDKIEHEKRIVDNMIQLYCRKNHQSSTDLCPDCETLRSYAFERLTHCPFKEKKTACKACKVHCYQKGKRNEIRTVMAFSGPRMMFYYPLDFLKHILK